jgi:gluconolactonase
LLLLFSISSIVPLKAGAPERRFELLAESAQFWKLLDHDAQLSTVASGFGFTEGPVWDPSGFLYVSDEEINKIFRVYVADGRKEEVVSLGDPDGNTYDREHHLLDCASALRAIIQVEPDGKYKILADRYQSKSFNSPNDVVIGPDGAIYFTDPTLDLVKGEKQEIPFQGVYRLDSNGEIRLLTKELTQPNGLAFSPDGRATSMTLQRNIVFMTSGRWHADERPRLREPGGKGDGVPDGMKVDKMGISRDGTKGTGCGIRKATI